MARRDPAKPGLADLERHRAAFEAGGITSPEIATALGVSPQKVNAAIKRDGWCRPVAKALSGGPAKGTVTTFTTAEAGDLLTSFAIATLARAHALVTDGDLGPSALKAVSAAAEAAEGILQRLGAIQLFSAEARVQKLEIAVLTPSEETVIREAIEAAAGETVED